MILTSHFFFRCRQLLHACFRLVTDAGIVRVGIANTSCYELVATLFQASLRLLGYGFIRHIGVGGY